MESGRVLALIPVGIGVLLAALLFRHDVTPNDIPLPDVDDHRVGVVESDDDVRARHAEASPLPAEVRALGDAIRTFNTMEAKNPPNARWAEIRASVDSARDLALAKGTDSVAELRAVQLARFLAEVRSWQKTGNESDELEAEGGGFIRRMTLEGWIHERTLVPSERELRVMFKLKWNAVARVEQLAALAPTFDEMRVLYRFYLVHPHAAEGARESFIAARRTARSPADCEALAAGEQIAIEHWRLEKLNKLAQLDPSYPAAFARGVSLFRATKYRASTEAFQEWLREHPDGPLTLRARNYLHAAYVRAQ